MKCQKCGKENIEWKSGVRYEGLDEHHNPPQYMFKEKVFYGKYINDGIENEIWKGEIYILCRECHTGKNGLHETIILPYLLKNSNLLKKNNNECWIWRYHIIPKDRIMMREEIFKLTKQWLEKEDDTNSTKTPE